MNMEKRFNMGWIVAMAGLSLVGCAKDHGDSCGSGDELAFEDTTYCVYKAGIIEEGFSCPAHVPNEYDFEGYKACGEPSEPPEGLEEQVFMVFRADGGSGATCEYNGKTYQTGDMFPSSDGCNTCSCNPDGAQRVVCSNRACVDGGVDASTETCPYMDLEYPVGEEFCAADKCNSCYCEQGTKNLVCTNRACIDESENYNPDLAAEVCR